MEQPCKDKTAERVGTDGAAVIWSGWSSSLVQFLYIFYYSGSQNCRADGALASRAACSNVRLPRSAGHAVYGNQIPTQPATSIIFVVPVRFNCVMKCRCCCWDGLSVKWRLAPSWALREAPHWSPIRSAQNVAIFSFRVTLPGACPTPCRLPVSPSVCPTNRCQNKRASIQKQI